MLSFASSIQYISSLILTTYYIFSSFPDRLLSVFVRSFRVPINFVFAFSYSIFNCFCENIIAAKLLIAHFAFCEKAILFRIIFSDDRSIIDVARHIGTWGLIRQCGTNSASAFFAVLVPAERIRGGNLYGMTVPTYVCKVEPHLKTTSQKRAPRL